VHHRLEYDVREPLALDRRENEELRPSIVGIDVFRGDSAEESDVQIELANSCIESGPSVAAPDDGEPDWIDESNHGVKEILDAKLRTIG
jgi:hypothetical protein